MIDQCLYSFLGKIEGLLNNPPQELFQNYYEQQRERFVDEIDNDALCALTIVCAFQFYSPVSGIAKEGLDILNNMFGKLMYLELPTGMNWMDHLDMLGALRMSSLGLKKSEPLLVSKFQEYSCAGIKKDSV